MMDRLMVSTYAALSEREILNSELLQLNQEIAEQKAFQHRQRVHFYILNAALILLVLIRGIKYWGKK